MKLFWSKKNVEKEDPKRLQQAFRNVFLHDKDGQLVLKVLLNDWNVFDLCKTDTQRALNEYAKVFLHDRLGIAGINIFAELDPRFETEE